MANRTFKGVQALNRGVVLIAGRCTVGAGNSVSVSDGLGFSVARTDPGMYELTLEDKYTSLLHCTATYVGTSEIGMSAQVTAEAVNSTGVVGLAFVNDAGAGEELSANAQFTFMLALRNSTVP